MNKKMKVLITSSLFLILMLPLYGQIAVEGELTRKREVSPGDVYEGVISIQNRGNKEEEVKVYLKDYSYSADGLVNYGDPEENERTNANWITFFPTDLILPPQGKGEIKYSVRIPDNEELTGTYWSMLFIEDVPENQSIDSTKLNTITISQIIRFGIQLITDIEGESSPRLSFPQIQLLSDEDGRFLDITVENTGDRWLSPELYVELYNEQGEYMGRYTGEKAKLYPTTSVSRSIRLTDVKEGNYLVLVVADCGDDLLFGGKYSLAIGN